MPATWAKGTQLQRKNPSTLIYETIPLLGDISGPVDSTDILDVTNHSSPGDFEEIIPTIQRSGEVSAPLYFDGNEPLHQALSADKQAKAKRSWKTILTDAGLTEIAYDGYVIGTEHAQPVAGALSYTLRIKPTGQLVITY